MTMQSTIFESSTDDLLIMIEESTRANQLTASYFIEPAQGTLQKAKSRRHQIVFGRRGSGKSSLLNKIHSENLAERKPSVFVDLEKFKGAIYPDVLISILIESFESYMAWLNGPAVVPASDKSFWQTFKILHPKKRIANSKEAAALAKRFEAEIRELGELLKEEERLSLEETRKNENAAEGNAKLGTPSGAPVKGHVAASASRSESVIRKVSYETQKHSKLQKKILEFQSLFKSLASVAGSEPFLILDDLYHIKRQDQADVLDYFHKLAKGGVFVLKIGTVRHRTDHYKNGNPPIGMKLGDDVSAVDLDVTLEKYATTKEFLFKILREYASANNANIDSILSDGAKDRLVLVSGGVARDFLSLFGKSVEEARERINQGNNSPGPRVAAQDVNRASGKFYDEKLQELERDTFDSEKGLIELDIEALRSFCLDKAKSNCILVEKDRGKVRQLSIGELVDLKILHPIRKGVTVSKRAGKRYDGFMLDYSFYTGDRTKRDIQLIEFWKPNASEELLRKVTFIYE